MLIWGFDNNLDCLSPSSGMTAWVLYILSQLRWKQVALGGGWNQQVTGTWCSGVRWAPSMFTGLPMCWDSFNTSWRSKIKCRSETRLKCCICWRIQVRFCFEMDFPHTHTYIHWSLLDAPVTSVPYLHRRCRQPQWDRSLAFSISIHTLARPKWNKFEVPGLAEKPQVAVCLDSPIMKSSKCHSGSDSGGWRPKTEGKSRKNA